MPEVLICCDEYTLFKIAELDCIYASCRYQQFIIDEQETEVFENRILEAPLRFVACTFPNPFSKTKEVGKRFQELVTIFGTEDLGEDKKYKFWLCAIDEGSTGF